MGTFGKIKRIPKFVFRKLSLFVGDAITVEAELHPNGPEIEPLDYYTGTFDPTGTADDAPSVYTSTWMNMGVFDPQIQLWTPQDFGKADTTSIDAATGNSSDYSKASDWHTFKDGTNTIQDVTGDLNGNSYQFFRIRMSFTLPAGQKRDDPVPYVDQLKIRVKY